MQPGENQNQKKFGIVKLVGFVWKIVEYKVPQTQK